MGDKVAILRPAELGVAGDIVKSQWSADGKVMLAIRRDPEKSDARWLEELQGAPSRETPAKPEVRNFEIWRYTPDTRIATRVMRPTDPNWKPDEITSIPKSSAFIFSGMRDGSGTPGDFGAYLVTQSGKLTPLTGPNDAYGQAEVSINSDLVAYSVSEFSGQKFVNQRLGLVGPNGVVRSMDMPENFVTFKWGGDGKTLLGFFKLAAASPEIRGKYEWRGINLAAQSFFAVDKEGAKLDAPASPPPKSGATAVDTPFVIPGKSVQLKTGVLFSEGGIGLVAGDIRDIEVSPSWKFVSYVAQGSLFVKPILIVDKDDFQKLSDRLAREEAISTAKQVGTAFAIFNSDNDDNFPSSRSDWKTAIMPYIKSKDMVDRFVYTYKGGNAMDIKNPADTVIGYVPGPGGRAEVHADTSVKWVKG